MSLSLSLSMMPKKKSSKLQQSSSKNSTMTYPDIKVMSMNDTIIKLTKIRKTTKSWMFPKTTKTRW